MNQFYFVANNLLAVLVAFTLSELLLPGRKFCRRGLATLGTFPIVILLSILLTSSLSRLNSTAIFCLLAITFIALAILCQRIKKSNDSLMPANSLPINIRSKIGGGLAMILAGLSGGYIAGRYIFPGTKFGWDELSYHTSFVAHWIKSEQMILAPLNYHAYYPFNAETLPLWFTLPFHSDAFAGLAGIYWLVLAIWAGIAIGLARKCSPLSTLLVSVLAVLSPVILQAVRKYSAVDIAGPAMLLASLAFALPSTSKSSQKNSMGNIIYCGLFVGFAVGCKISFAPYVIVLLLWFLFRPATGFSNSLRVKTSLVFLVSVAITGSFWYLRNAFLTGNPFFPAELGPFDGPLSSEALSRTKLITWIAQSPWDLQQWKTIIEKHARWPLGLFILSITGYIYTLCNLKELRRKFGKEIFSAELLLLIVGGLIFLLYPIMPFSGTANGANATLNIILRYMIAPIMIGLLLLARSFDNGTPLRRGWIGLVMILAMIPYQNKYMHCGQVLCVIALVGLSYYGWKKIRPISQSYSIPKWIPVLLLTSLLTGWSLCLPYQQEKTDRNLYRFGHDPQRPIGAAWKALETLPPASKITWFGPGAYLYYPLFGRNLQFNPIKINSQGPYQPLHIRWQKDPDSVKWWKKKTPPNPSQLIHQLTTQPVDYILITQWNKHEWPAENDIIATSNKFQPIYNDDYSIIWKKKTD